MRHHSSLALHTLYIHQHDARGDHGDLNPFTYGAI